MTTRTGRGPGSQAEARLRCRTGLGTGLAPRALLQVAVPLAASVIAHAAAVATLPGGRAARVASVASASISVASAELPAEWVEAPEPVSEAEESPALPASPAALSREPAAQPPSDAPAPPARVELPPPDAIPGVHLAAAPDAKARAAWWAAARQVPVGPLDSRDGYDAIRAQIAGWSPKLVTGTYVPGGARVAHPDEMPSRRVPAAVITSVLQASAGRFHVCHGAGLPLSATISGDVLVAFVLEPDGHVSGARDAGGTFPDDAVRRCVVRAVAQLSFPKPPDGAAQQVTVPVVLQTEEAQARGRGLP